MQINGLLTVYKAYYNKNYKSIEFFSVQIKTMYVGEEWSTDRTCFPDRKPN